MSSRPVERLAPETSLSAPVPCSQPLEGCCHVLRGKHLLLLYWLHQSLWLCVSEQTRIFLKRWKYQTILPASWEICMQVKKQQLKLDVEQWTGSKLGKEYVKAVYSVWFSSVPHLCPTLCDPMDCSMPGLPVHHWLSEFTQTHVHWVGEAIQASHPVIPCILSPCLFNLYAEYIMWNVGWMKHKLQSRLQREISITSDMQMTPPLWKKVTKN